MNVRRTARAQKPRLAPDSAEVREHAAVQQVDGVSLHAPRFALNLSRVPAGRGTYSHLNVVSRAHPLQMQAKLAISEPGDVYEQEADRVAERVMRMPVSCGSN